MSKKHYVEKEGIDKENSKVSTLFFMFSHLESKGNELFKKIVSDVEQRREIVVRKYGHLIEETTKELYELNKEKE